MPTLVERQTQNLWVVSLSLTTVSISQTALGKLLTTNVHPLDPGDEWMPDQGQFLNGCINGCIYSQRVQMVKKRVYQACEKGQGDTLVK